MVRVCALFGPVLCVVCYVGVGLCVVCVLYVCMSVCTWCRQHRHYAYVSLSGLTSVPQAATLGLCANVVTCDYHDDSKLAAALLANLPRLVQNVRANAAAPVDIAAGGPWAFMSARGRFLEWAVRDQLLRTDRRRCVQSNTDATQSIHPTS